ncbi:MAG: c-type cytochrome biogenesis protein CcmF, partial [Gammaproteobacteria bacterium]|nr:c-type cytochrome biogenesis protein CcmF [Gammaproteobacteria bacterium]
MIPELGNFALILSLCLAVVLATVPMIGSLNNTPGWVALARPAALGQFTFLLISFACLVNAFLSNDFSVLYVAQNGNSQLPIIYKISAVWGAHEGSLLLWALILGTW